ncbi:sugar O-acetyltransferase [Novacetimonas hansenii]|uniref:Acetyltransferase n=2 Tax=Novacetimonas hansenii TaxID=436 RepID=A0ABQ0SIZ5_NOVHA|nr:sugar O-acetyltransferase [Novacetimonas hansenii]GAN82700.1 maltose O-acetyltransferase [Novacetimonas hansenii JCM 7643]GBQ53961.1 acetyltransferase [Novacetimonas hansenii NRIC 0243]GEC65299.1 maltose O-acetyltransferase [Novacetimonas hansenii]
MKEMEKAAAGFLYDANFDAEVVGQRNAAKDILFEFNHTPPRQAEKRKELLQSLLGQVGNGVIIEAPFHCDYGFNIEIGANSFLNVNCVILDGAKVAIGSNVFIAPAVGIHTAGHPLDSERRDQGLEYAFPVTIEDSVWIGAGAQIMPGVTIGRGSVIGAGAIVNRDIPPFSVAVGNPARILRTITEKDREKYRTA